MDHILPSWKKYPDRSKSFVCSTSQDQASDYGNVYRVYPAGNPLIAICSSFDYWGSFPYLNKITKIDSMKDFNYEWKARLFNGKYDSLAGLLKTIEYYNKIWPDKEKLKKVFNKELGELLSFDRISWNKVNSSSSSFSELLNELLSPEMNKFQLIRLSELKNSPMDKEIWFSGPAYFLKEDE